MAPTATETAKISSHRSRRRYGSGADSRTPWMRWSVGTSVLLRVRRRCRKRYPPVSTRSCGWIETGHCRCCCCCQSSLKGDGPGCQGSGQGKTCCTGAKTAPSCSVEGPGKDTMQKRTRPTRTPPSPRERPRERQWCCINLCIVPLCAPASANGRASIIPTRKRERSLLRGKRRFIFLTFQGKKGSIYRDLILPRGEEIRPLVPEGVRSAQSNGE